MATNLDIDQKLLEEAVKYGNHKTKKSAVNEALAEYVQKKKQLGIIELFGTLDWDESYDYKAERKRGNKRIPKSE
ncbi:type II toxin-antitoxin system VapB family antitoxin [Marinoscillum sp.]|uniref:type II toxin-antitoxin system VapB family antitoxin n=1 Tax=Marinoscillum sp. TaxID=2024838 RepID=UPI003BAC3FF8